MPVTKQKLQTLVAAINLRLDQDDAALLTLHVGPRPRPYRIAAEDVLHPQPRRLTEWLTAHDCHTWLQGFLAARLHDGAEATERAAAESLGFLPRSGGR